MRKAADTVCQDCWAHTRTGLDADRAALTAVVDNFPLTRTGELLAATAGRATYALDILGALHRRDRWSIRRESVREPVLAAHVCGQPLPASWLAPPPPRPATQPAAEGMPF